MFRSLIGVAIISVCAGCNSESSILASDTQSKSTMRTEFMDSCRERPEYVASKRTGTLDEHCSCVFNKTMKGLSDKEQIIAGFYLYGETHAGFKERQKTNPIYPKTMMRATEAVGRAAQNCR